MSNTNFEATVAETENQNATVTEAENQSPTQAVVFTTDVNIPLEVREEIIKKAQELKQQNRLRKIFIAIVEGDEDEKPFYIAYLRRPSLMHFSQYMNFAQKDVVQANQMLAKNVFLGGDRELIDDEDLFLYGLMSQLNHIIDSRNADLVKK